MTFSAWEGTSFIDPNVEDGVYCSFRVAMVYSSRRCNAMSCNNIIPGVYGISFGLLGKYMASTGGADEAMPV